MILQYYDVPTVNPAGNYQCGLVGWYFGPNSSCYYQCFSCPVPAKSVADIANVFSMYPQFAGNYVYGQPLRMRYQFSYTHISKEQLKNSIGAGSPVFAGISPSGFFKGISEHATVIVGYDEDDDGNMFLTINDPFPYDLPMFARMSNPYVRAGGIDNGDGSYEIGFEEYINNLQWHETLYNFSIE